jgi:glycerophosphoryl diester phosphodiesterase
MDPAVDATLLRTFARGWRTLLGIHLLFTLAAATLSAPLAAGAIQGAVLVSGQPALSDTDIAGFLFSPCGAAAGLAIGALVVTLQLLGYATLLIPARSFLKHGTCAEGRVLPLLIPALPRLLRLSLRFIVLLAGISLPFAGLLAAIYFGMLGEHDINFYLAEKPPVFRRAALLASLVAAAHLVVVARVASGWVHALPLAIFRGEAPAAALRISRQAAAGQRKSVFAGLLAWALLTPLAAWLLNLPWSMFAMLAARHLSDRLGLLVVVLGLCFALAAALAWAVGFAGLSLLALRNTRLYLAAGLDREASATAPALHLSLGWKSALAGGLALCGGSVFLSQRWIESVHGDRPAVVIAHRGASAAAPENTLAAVAAAIDARADWIEIDVQQSADGGVFVFHDSDFKRVRGPAKPLRMMRDDEIATIDVGSWKSPAFAGERVPRLAEVLALCKDRAGVLIELKYYGPRRDLEARVVEEVEDAGMTDEVMVMSLSHEGVRKIRELRPAWRVGLLSSVALGKVARLDLDFLGLNARTTSRQRVREAQRRGVQVHVWTVNDPVDMAVQLGRGVDGLITDHPALARQVLAERTEASFGEKLLLDLAGVLGKRPPTPRQ